MSEKIILVEFEDVNSVDYRWTWTFWLEAEAEGSFKLIGEQYVEGEGSEFTKPVHGLNSNYEIIRVLGEMLSEAGYDFDQDWHKEVASVVAELGIK